MIEEENRKGLFLVITGLIILILIITWIIAVWLDVRFCIFGCDILILFLGAFGLFVFFVGIYSLLPNPRMKGLLFLIIGSFLTGVGLYFTRYLLLNIDIIKSKSSSIYWTHILTIIGILIITYGIIQIDKKINRNLV